MYNKSYYGKKEYSSSRLNMAEMSMKSMKKHTSESGHRNIDRSKDAGHFEWTTGMILTCKDNEGNIKHCNQYRVDKHLGDGTFGRALKCTQVSGDFTKDEEE